MEYHLRWLKKLLEKSRDPEEMRTLEELIQLLGEIVETAERMREAELNGDQGKLEEMIIRAAGIVRRAV